LHINNQTVGFKNCENAFFLASTILRGCDAIEEFVATEIWLISSVWKPANIILLDVDWATQQVSFPRFNPRLKEGQSLDDFIHDVENKVDAMVGESMLNEYKAYKNLVEHKKRVNRVFSELGVETALRSLPPGLDKKVPTVAVASCSAAPPKAPQQRSSKKGRSSAVDTSSSVIRPDKTKSLESSKRKHKLLKIFLMLRFRWFRVLLS
jgi:hypothetical protein